MLPDEQMVRLQPFFPRNHGKPPVDDHSVLSGIIFVDPNGLKWHDAPRGYGPAKTLHNRWKRCNNKGIFVAMMNRLSANSTERKTIMIDTIYLNVHGTASSLRVKRDSGRLIGRTKGDINTKLHAVTDAMGRPVIFFVTAGQVSDYIGAAALMNGLPKAQWLLRDRGYNADWFHDTLEKKGIIPRIPGRKSRTQPAKCNKRRYKRRNRIEIMFGRIKDWRRVATRYDRCPADFRSAVALAAAVMFWL